VSKYTLIWCYYFKRTIKKKLREYVICIVWILTFEVHIKSFQILIFLYFIFLGFNDIGKNFPPPLVMINLRRGTCWAIRWVLPSQSNFLHMHKSEIETLTTCLRRSNPLPLRQIHCWYDLCYFISLKYCFNILFVSFYNLIVIFIFTFSYISNVIDYISILRFLKSAM
jgi:hypothetical protein